MVFELALRFFRFWVSGDEEMEHEEGDVMDEDEDMDDTKLMSSLEYFGQN